MAIQQRDRRPTPGVRLGLAVRRRRELDHRLQRQRPVLGHGVLNDADSAPLGHFLAVLGHVAERQPAVMPAVRAQVFRHALHVPRRAATAQHREHESVRSLVQQQMAAIVVAGLLVDPQRVVPRIAVQKRRQIAGQQAALDESGLVLHQHAGHPPIGVFAFLDAEVPAPLRKRLLEHFRQLIDFAARKVGVEREPLAG